MPSTLAAIDVFLGANVLFGPAKAANAGGVAVSALEMSQNSMRLSWTFEEVDAKLHDIMKTFIKLRRSGRRIRLRRQLARWGKYCRFPQSSRFHDCSRRRVIPFIAFLKSFIQKSLSFSYNGRI